MMKPFAYYYYYCAHLSMLAKPQRGRYTVVFSARDNSISFKAIYRTLHVLSK